MGTEIASKIPVWPTPANMELMGAKDALTKIKDMDFGLPDTLGYYSPAQIKTDFPKTIKFQKRVVKQNRGSAGEGIWIIELKDKNYCKNYGDAVAEMSGVRMAELTSRAHGPQRVQASISRVVLRPVVRWLTSASAPASMRVRHVL